MYELFLPFSNLHTQLPPFPSFLPPSVPFGVHYKADGFEKRKKKLSIKKFFLWGVFFFFFSNFKNQTEEDKNVSYAQVADIAREIALTCYDVYSKINGELKDKKESFVVLISKADCRY